MGALSGLMRPKIRGTVIKAQKTRKIAKIPFSKTLKNVDFFFIVNYFI
jgi:hypothetical protein